MDFKKYKIKDIGEVVGGATPLTKDSNNYDGDISWITPNDLSNHKDVYINRGERNITAKGLKEIGNKLLPKGTVLFSSRAPIGYVAIANQELCTNQGFKSVIPNFEKVTSEYLYYTLGFYKSFIEKQGSGTTFMEVSGATMENIELPFPALEEQRKISDTLIKIDQKISLNNRINAELEAMAKQLYDYWFVQFDFPDENGKPYKSSGGKMVYNSTLKREIPEAFWVSRINEFCDIVDCLHSKKPEYKYETEESYLLTLENITKDGYIDLGTKYYISKKDFEEWTSRVEVQPGDFLFTNAGRAGDLGMVPEGVFCAIGRNITSVRPLRISSQYLRCFFKSLYLREQILNNLDQGSFFMSFNVRSIKNLQILIPPQYLLDRFIPKIKNIIKIIEIKNNEISQLSNLRDSLLPMLMNGQVTVE